MLQWTTNTCEQNQSIESSVLSGSDFVICILLSIPILDFLVHPQVVAVAVALVLAGSCIWGKLPVVHLLLLLALLGFTYWKVS